MAFTFLQDVLESEPPSKFALAPPEQGTLSILQSEIRVLVVGAGGLGCEILKDLGLSGFRDIHIIDLDTIDVSNLNRQFLFRKSHVGQAKAEIAAKVLNEKLGKSLGVNVTPHVGRIQDKGETFFKSFNIVIAGLDNIPARRWLNHLLHRLVKFCATKNEETGQAELDSSTVIPLLDGGTEGLKGQARVILPGMGGSCFECSLDMFPLQQNFPVCTIAQTPRQPEHCIEYAILIEWEREFGEKKPKPEMEQIGSADTMSDVEPSSVKSATDTGAEMIGFEDADLAEIRALTKKLAQQKSSLKLSFDDPEHVRWLFLTALRRAEAFGIEGVTRSLTLGVGKRIIPAIASTNAIVSATLVQEALKLLTYRGPMLNNYMMYMGGDGVYTHTFALQRKENCIVCGGSGNSSSTELQVNPSWTLQELLDHLATNVKFQLKRPSITSGAGVVFLQNPEAMRKQHEYKLSQSLRQLVDFGVFYEGEELVVTDRESLSDALRVRIGFLG